MDSIVFILNKKMIVDFVSNNEYIYIYIYMYIFFIIMGVWTGLRVL